MDRPVKILLNWLKLIDCLFVFIQLEEKMVSEADPFRKRSEAKAKRPTRSNLQYRANQPEDTYLRYEKD